MAKKIHVKIHPDGRIEADIKGFKGDACLKYLAMLEKILAAETIDKQFTDEYFDSKNVLTDEQEISE